MAVRRHPTTREPYLQFPAPDAHLRLTPFRPSDAPATIAAFNDPRVYPNLLSPPYPYLQRHWDASFPAIEAATRRAGEELDEVERWRENGAPGEGKRWVGAGLPFTAIREVVGAGKRGGGGVEGGEGEGVEVLLGRVAIRRADYRTVRDEAERARLREANEGLAAGDPRIEWEMGFWLCPAAQGRGIMTTVLRTLLETFFVGYMNVHNLKGSYLTHNKGSKRVLEKCGFVFESEEVDVFEVAESKTGGIKGQMVGAVHMRWKA